MADPGESFVDANGIRLHYLDWGGDGPPAVLLHATGFLARLWQPIALGLRQRRHVYAYDARGHGDSDKPVPSEAGGPDEGYGWPAIADDLRSFLEALRLRGVFAVGHSSGAAGVAHLAATRPEYVAAAVLIEPTIFPPMPEEAAAQRRRFLASSAAKRRMVWHSREELVRTYRGRPAFARWDDDLLRLYAQHGTFPRDDGQVQLKCPGEIEAILYERSLSTETWDLVPHIRCPTLVLRGAETEQMLGTVAADVAERIPGARLVTISGAGHFLPMERPDLVLAEILSFLDQGAPK